MKVRAWLWAILSGHTSWPHPWPGKVTFTLLLLSFSVPQFPCGRNKSSSPRTVVRTDGLMQWKSLKQALPTVSPYLTSEETGLPPFWLSSPSVVSRCFILPGKASPSSLTFCSPHLRPRVQFNLFVCFTLTPPDFPKTPLHPS